VYAPAAVPEEKEEENYTPVTASKSECKSSTEQQHELGVS